MVGFYTSPSSQTPPDAALAKFVDAGPCVYIGFGSVVVADPAALTRTILEAVKLAKVRAVISAGWAEIGGVGDESVFVAKGNVPHDWLFADGRVSAVVHHGGEQHDLQADIRRGHHSCWLARGCANSHRSILR